MDEPQRRQQQHEVPVLQPGGSLVRVCVWCWYQFYPHTPFPRQWSSSICQKHRARVRRAYDRHITAGQG
ncbi:MAG: hypothetical protein J2P37_23695 [Ktedonobacteraceae bacterium]|nr:hypothetical protein [Ktedonobacteraceae bacterium]